MKDSKGLLNEFDQKNLFITKWDSGAFDETAWNETEDGSLSLLVGDPLLTKAGKRLARSQQLSSLVMSDGKLDVAVLAQTRGVFSVISFDRPSNKLNLATDMIGLRSIYYTVQNGMFIFASALRILEEMNCVAKSLLLPGMVELSVFAFPLANRTPYTEISILRECELLVVDINGINLTSYFDWGCSAQTLLDHEASVSSIFSIFQDAVRLRSGSDRNTYAFLSGGMDSRAIVASLLQNGVAVKALNFSPDGSQDQVYAKLFVDAAIDAGALCKLHCLDRNNDPNFSLLAFEAKQNLEKAESVHVDRSSFIWSGDGGSVGLGHVYLDEVILNHADEGDFKTAVEAFLSKNRLTLPVNVLKKVERHRLSKILADNVTSEINRYQRADLGRRLYLFLLFNDQRRHLFKHFESIDEHGLEFLLPFYDINFLKLIVDTPASWGLMHKLYVTWFAKFPAYVRKTPWQTYPGHIPCPLVGDNSLTYQWAGREAEYKENILLRARQTFDIIGFALSFSLPVVFSRFGIFIASLLHLFGIRNYEYIIKMLSLFSLKSSYASKNKVSK